MKLVETITKFSLLTASRSTSSSTMRQCECAGLMRGSYLDKVLSVVRVELGRSSLGHGGGTVGGKLGASGIKPS